MQNTQIRKKYEFTLCYAYFEKICHENLEVMFLGLIYNLVITSNFLEKL